VSTSNKCEMEYLGDQMTSRPMSSFCMYQRVPCWKQSHKHERCYILF